MYGMDVIWVWSWWGAPIIKYQRCLSLVLVIVVTWFSFLLHLGITSLWLPITVERAKTLLIHTIWKCSRDYSETSPQPWHSGLIHVQNCHTWCPVSCCNSVWTAIIWPLTTYKVQKTPLICIDWMWCEYYIDGGLNHITPWLCPLNVLQSKLEFVPETYI
jgi:hypothetical protein